MATANQGPLTLVNNDLVAITTLVGSAMNLATQSLLNADLSLAEKVIHADANIDALCSAVESRCLELRVLRDLPCARVRPQFAVPQ